MPHTTTNSFSIEFYTTEQAAEVIKLDPSQVRRYCRTGHFAGAFRAGRDWFIPRDSVKKFRPLPAGNPNFIKKTRKKRGK